MTDTADIQAALAPVAAGRAMVRMNGARADVILDVTGLEAQARETLEADVRAAALAVSGVEDVRIAQTASRPQRRLIAVASGKGGVGKSTVSANLAVALAQRGRKVGLVDADIYGPSQPKLMGAEEAKPQAREKTLIPVDTAYDVKMLSMGQLVGADQALAWRGPMATSALGQLIDADWGDIDTLILDLPPGTGDVQLTMVQKHKPVGAVIVSTPQDLALIDARRAIALFEKTGVPIVGIVENMAGYRCPDCGSVSDPFGRGGAEAAATDIGVPLLGRVPLDIAIREQSDAGTPPAAGNGEHATAFHGIAGALSDWLDAQGDR